MNIKRAHIYWGFALVMAGMTLALLFLYKFALDMEVQRQGLPSLIGSGALITAVYSAVLIYAGWKVRKSDD